MAEQRRSKLWMLLYGSSRIQEQSMMLYAAKVSLEAVLEILTENRHVGRVSLTTKQYRKGTARDSSKQHTFLPGAFRGA